MNRSIRQALSVLKKGEHVMSFPAAIAAIKHAYSLLSPPKASPKAKATRARKRADDERERQLRAKKSKALHEKVDARPGDDCELGEHYWPRERVHHHHLKAGSAKRATEALHNLIRACNLDHDGWHTKGPEAFREQVLRWCARNGYPIPPVFLREPRGRLVECDRCDGCGWYEGGPTLKTTCERCGGSGSLPAPQAPESLPERIAK